jgi:hypothetical protein
MSLLDTASLIVTPNGYKEGKLFSVIPSDGSGDLSVTRATTATRVNSAGLVELVPYNLVTYSQDFSNAAWTKVNATITANSTTAPDGTLTANKFESNGAGVPQLSQSISGTNTISIYAKAGNISNFRMWIGSEVAFDLSNGTVISGTATIEDAGNGWYRCIISSTNAGAFNPYFVASASGQFVYVWGAQVVEGSTAKDYQKTETRLNIPRLDYSNGTCPSLLVEPQRTNIIPYSETFQNWTTGFSALTPNAVTTNYAISPDGTQNADRIQLTINASNTVSQIYQFPSSSTTTYTASVWLKSLSGTPTVAIVDTYNTTGGYKLVTLTTEWVRHTVTFGASSGGIIPQFLLLYGTTSNSADFLAYGFQIEEGSYATSYIPTTSASVTRNADVVYRDSLSVFGTNQGTFFTDCEGPDFNNYEHLFDLSDNSSGSVNRYTIFSKPNGLILYTNQEYQINVSNTARKKIAIAWDATNTRVFINGSQVLSFSYANPNPTSINLGSRLDGGAGGKSRFYSAVTWPTKLDDATLATLTTL